MTSTPEQRINRTKQLLETLLGSQWNKHAYSDRRPFTLPKGMNYTNKEWIKIHDAQRDITRRINVSIQLIFELDAIADKYQNELFLTKLHT
jgi:hypothetical protein